MEYAPRHFGVFVCSHVFQRIRPVLIVVHYDSNWDFMCGSEDHGDNWHHVGIGRLLDADASLNECADLPNSSIAERQAVGQPWYWGLL